jgi:hypothetical protein
MSGTVTESGRPSAMGRALARDKLGIIAVLAFILASIAPMTVAAGVIPTAYAVTGLTGIPVAFLAVAVVLGLFCPGYMAMSRRIRNSGAFYAFVSAGLGKVTGVAAALVALVAYESFQVATYGALGPAIQAEAAAHLGVHEPWWVWSLIVWAVVSGLGLARVEVAGRVLAVLTAAEIVLVAAETVAGLASPAGGHLDLRALSPATLTASGAGAIGVLAVIAGLAFVGFEQSPVLGEFSELRNDLGNDQGRWIDGGLPDACSTAWSSSWMLRSSMLVRVCWRSTGMPWEMLAMRRSIRCSLLEQGRCPAVRAVIAAGQSMMAICRPSVSPWPRVMNSSVKSVRCSQVAWAMSSSVAASRQ